MGAPIGPDGHGQQGSNVGRRGGGGDGQLQALLAGLLHQSQHPWAQADLAVAHRSLVKRGFDQVQALHRFGHGARLELFHVRFDLTPVVQHAFFATRNVQQFGVLGLAPVPVQALLRKGLVESFQVGVLGVGQGAVHIKNQSLEHPHLLQKTTPLAQPVTYYKNWLK